MLRRPSNASLTLILVLLALILGACNLSSSDATQEIDLTLVATTTPQPTRTVIGTGNAPTTLPLPTSQFTPSRPTPIIIIPPTSIVNLPTFTPLPLPVNIAILSPVPGNVVSGNVQVLGAATHPQFLQYQLEYGPDPNPGNLWFPATTAIQSPVLNGLVGIWNTNATQDALYQLRVRVYLRDGSTLTTVVNNIRVQNQAPTPIPTATQNTPRPIAAFTQNQTTGQAPLNVQFTNQSSGNITSILWNFGDGATSDQANPLHTFTTPGLYNVTLTVTGPGGSSNVTRQISAQGATPPVAGFTQSAQSGFAPLSVQFTSTSTGNITNYLWNFSDGTVSDQPNPQHSFAIAGTYNIFLTVTGPGGSSSVTRQLTVMSNATATNTNTNTPIPPTPTNTATLAIPTETPTNTVIPPTDVAPTETPTETATPELPTETPTETVLPPTETATEIPTETALPPTETATDIPTETPTETATEVPTETATEIPTETPTSTPEPVAVNFSAQQVEGLTVAFTNQSSGQASSFNWEFGDGATSTEMSPTHVYATGGSYLVRLTAFDLGGNPFISEQQIQVNDPIAVAFTPQVNGLGVFFSNQSTGQISAYQWEFGDGATSTEFEPTHTYAAGGSYLVRLTAYDLGGNPSVSEQQIQVDAPITAAFTPQVNGLDVFFSNQSTGQISAYQWNFGDGATSTEFEPTHTYTAGTYNASLTVVGQDGVTTNVANQEVVIEAQSVDPGLVVTVPVIPAPSNNLRGIYDSGVSAGNRPTVFAYAGDQTLAQSGALDPFAVGGTYDLGSRGDLQGIIDWYNFTDLGGVTTFNSDSRASRDGWRIEDLLNPNNNPAGCEGYGSPFACEIDQKDASVVLVTVGYNDVQALTDVNAFRNNLDSLIQTATNAGVVPVVFTVRPSSDGGTYENQTRLINDAIIEIAAARNIPVVNLWAAIKDLPNSGLDGAGNLTVSPSSGGDLSDSGIANYGVSALNSAILRTLNDIRNGVFPDAVTP